MKNYYFKGSPGKKRKIRQIIGDKELAKETKDALEAERERKKRIEEKRKVN